MSVTLTRPLLLVGCGKMGAALLSGWLNRGKAADRIAEQIYVIDPLGAPGFATEPTVSAVTDAADLPADLDPEVVVFAVKPQLMAEVAPLYRRFAKAETLFLSIAAGTTIGFFESRLGAEASIVRAMPNTPASIGQGITVACPNGRATKAQDALAQTLLSVVGEAILVEDEALLDPVTALSGSGPAYVFLLIETMAAAGVEAGLPRDLAERLARVTVAGAGQLALLSDEHPGELREHVTSPGGTTFEALQVLMAEDGMQALMTKAIAAATRRSRELAAS